MLRIDYSLKSIAAKSGHLIQMLFLPEWRVKKSLRDLACEFWSPRFLLVLCFVVHLDVSLLAGRGERSRCKFAFVDHLSVDRFKLGKSCEDQTSKQYLFHV